MPQVLMLTAASRQNKKRLDKDLGKERQEREDTEGETFNGKPVEELNTDEYMRYLHS